MVVLAIIAFRSYRPGAQIFDVTTVTKLIDVELVLTVLGAGAVLFAIYALIRQRSEETDDKKRAEDFSELALDEIASAMYNFGSILVIVTLAGGPIWYLLIGILVYICGLFFKATD
jgi:hypothetical protein